MGGLSGRLNKLERANSGPSILEIPLHESGLSARE